jgi:hypothetical protein
VSYFFVLGARDPETVEITRAAQAQGLKCTHATLHGIAVRSSEAYSATGVQGLLPSGGDRVFVECSVMGLVADHQCDHHNEGDPGFGMPPERFMEGSSLGQVLSLLGIEATPEQRVIAAADHCLMHAYQGKCPGIDPEVLADWRERNRAGVRRITVEELRSRIGRAMEVLKAARRITIRGTDVAFFPPTVELPEETPEASARLAIPFCYVRKQGRKRKAGIMSATPDVIGAWMRDCGLTNVYGDPARGFAGGYF